MLKGRPFGTAAQADTADGHGFLAYASRARLRVDLWASHSSLFDRDSLSKDRVAPLLLAGFKSD